MYRYKLIALVKGGHVNGWDDPRLPTLSGVRRRGVPPEAVKLFVQRTGVSKAEQQHRHAGARGRHPRDPRPRRPRAFAVLRPLKVTLTDWPAGRVEFAGAGAPGSRSSARASCRSTARFTSSVTTSRRSLRPSTSASKPGGEVRLRFGYVIKCREVVKDADGTVVELKCTHEPTSKSGAKAPSELAGNGKIKGIIHWLSAAAAVPASVRLYDRLFSEAQPGASHDDGDFLRDLNPHSLEDLADAYVEPGVAGAAAGDSFQFERMGYFRADEDTADGRLVFNRIDHAARHVGKGAGARAQESRSRRRRRRRRQKPLSPAAAPPPRKCAPQGGGGARQLRPEASRPPSPSCSLKAEDA